MSFKDEVETQRSAERQAKLDADAEERRTLTKAFDTARKYDAIVTPLLTELADALWPPTLWIFRSWQLRREFPHMATTSYRGHSGMYVDTDAWWRVSVPNSRRNEDAVGVRLKNNQFHVNGPNSFHSCGLTEVELRAALTASLRPKQ